MIPGRLFDRLKFWDFSNTLTVPAPLVCVWIFLALNLLSASIAVQNWNRELIASGNQLIEVDRRLGARADELQRELTELEEAQVGLLDRCNALDKAQVKLRLADAELKSACGLGR